MSKAAARWAPIFLWMRAAVDGNGMSGVIVATIMRSSCSGVTAEQLDLIIVATITPDMPFPSTAALIQRKIGAHRAAALDIEAACSRSIYALEISQQLIRSCTCDTA